MGAPLRDRPGLLSQRATKVAERAPFARFFAVLAEVERLTAGSVRVGGDGPPSQEAIRFRHDHSLAFAPGDLRAVRFGRIPLDPQRPEEGWRPGFEVIASFFGLSGSVSPLPTRMAEEISLEDAGQAPRQDFLDIFHHRLLSLLYRSVARYRPAHEHRSDGADPWLHRTIALSGLDMGDALLDTLPAPTRLRLAPLFASRSRGALALLKALRIALRDLLGEETVEVRLEEMTGSSTSIREGERMRLGARTARLGRSAVLGARVRDPSSGIRLHVGPVSEGGRDAFLEGDLGVRTARAVTSRFTHHPVDIEILLRWRAERAAGFRLGGPSGARLGVDTSLGAARHEHVVRLTSRSREDRAA